MVMPKGLVGSSASVAAAAVPSSLTGSKSSLRRLAHGWSEPRDDDDDSDSLLLLPKRDEWLLQAPLLPRAGGAVAEMEEPPSDGRGRRSMGSRAAKPGLPAPASWGDMTLDKTGGEGAEDALEETHAATGPKLDGDDRKLIVDVLE